MIWCSRADSASKVASLNAPTQTDTNTPEWARRVAVSHAESVRFLRGKKFTWFVPATEAPHEKDLRRTQAVKA
jgi:hypothetical protein